MIRLQLAGPHTRLDADLCGRCPQGVTGCCAAPPVVAWADLGRIVLLGGRDWLLAELAAARLYPCARGLALLRVDNPDAQATGRAKKCVHHGAGGCTIPSDRRSATCNYYVCDEAWQAAGSSSELRRARARQDRLTDDYARWDGVLGERVRARHPEGPPWGEAFLDWLGAELGALWAPSAR